MGSIVLPQALVVVPRNPTRCIPQKLAYSACVSRKHSQLNVFSHNSLGLSSKWEIRSFVVRAEAEGEPGAVEAEVPAETENETEVEAEAEAAVAVATEERPPFKPRTKLGDIMGIIFLNPLFTFAN